MEKVEIPGPELVTIADSVPPPDHSTLDATVNSIGQDCSKEPDQYLQACKSRFSGE